MLQAFLGEDPSSRRKGRTLRGRLAETRAGEGTGLRPRTLPRRCVSSGPRAAGSRPAARFASRLSQKMLSLADGAMAGSAKPPAGPGQPALRQAVSGSGSLVLVLLMPRVQSPKVTACKNNSGAQPAAVNTFRSLLSAVGLQSEGREETVFFMRCCPLPRLSFPTSISRHVN